MCEWFLVLIILKKYLLCFLTVITEIFTTGCCDTWAQTVGHSKAAESVPMMAGFPSEQWAPQAILLPVWDAPNTVIVHHKMQIDNHSIQDYE